MRYAGEPDISALRDGFKTTIGDLSAYFAQTAQAYNDRRNIWANKSSDLRKHGADPFPWEGASDQEAHTVDEKIKAYVSILVGALKRSNIRAYPVEVGDSRSARTMSAFFKWLKGNYVKGFYKTAERSANYWLEKGLMISHVGWEKADRTFLEVVTLEQIAEQSPEFAELFADAANEEDLAAILRQSFPSMSKGRAKRVVRGLRTRGEAEVPFSRRTVDRPTVTACSPDSEVFFPSWCIDPQRAPFCFWRTYMTPQEVELAVTTKGWNREWADYAIENLVGMENTSEGQNYGRRIEFGLAGESDLIEVVYGYQRLIDEEDGSEGIYCTIFSPVSGDRFGPAPEYAKHELLSGLDEYPFVVTRLTEDQDRLYDLRTFADLFRGTQNQVKVERDQRIDRSSMATLPPIMHPNGRRPQDYGPGRFIAERREGEIRFGPVPQFDAGSMEVENTLIAQSDRVVGLDPEDVDAPMKKQFYVDKYLEHHAEVLMQVYKAYRRYGPERLQFRVTGYADPMMLEKGIFDEDLDLMVTYDVLNNDPENTDARIKQFMSLAQMDRFGKIDQEALIEIIAGAIDPVLADAVIKTKEESTQNVLSDVTDDLAKIHAGIEVGARQGGAQVALQAIQAYAQQPDVAQSLQENEAFAGRLEKYATQYQFQLQQAQNAEIGRIGSVPATFQGVQ